MPAPGTRGQVFPGERGAARVRPWLLIFTAASVVYVLAALFLGLPELLGDEAATQSVPDDGAEQTGTPLSSGAAPISASLLNGIPLDQIVILSPQAVQAMSQVADLGKTLGRNSRAFSKIGDSTMESPHFMDRFDQGTYNLGEYQYLQPAIVYFAGSFARQGVAVQRGLHSWTVFDPMWANDPSCLANEGPVDCEIRLHNPAVVMIRLGSNDIGPPQLFESNMRLLVSRCLDLGIVPVIGTKADRNEGIEDRHNVTLRAIAAELSLPLWDFDRVAQSLPDRGIRSDGVHLTYFSSQDYTEPGALQTGYAVHNLTALMMLDRLMRDVLP